MTAFTPLKTSIALAALALGSLAAVPAAAAPVAWATWGSVVTGTTTGSAAASFAGTGVSAGYTGELEQFVSSYPSYTPGGTFSGGNVSNPPPAANGIVRIFGGAGTGTSTLTFSQAVLNPVIAIWSLGQPGIIAQFVFNQPFVIEASGTNAEYGGAPITAVGNTVFGAEGNGLVEFLGSVTSISWTNPVAEDWYGFTVGVPAAPVPEPETYALMLAGLALLGAGAKRRKAKAGAA